jgi:hypothetical protein
MSFDIIQIIPRPNGEGVQTDFPAIAFRSARQDPVTNPANAAPDKRARSVNQVA